MNLFGYPKNYKFIRLGLRSYLSFHCDIFVAIGLRQGEFYILKIRFNVFERKLIIACGPNA